MTPDELMAEACRLAALAATNGWGGPFGAVVARDGEVVGRGHNQVLVTGDPTAHAEIVAIRNAAEHVNLEAMIDADGGARSTLELIARPDGSADEVPERARMLYGMELYTSSFPCPMCLSATWWARIEKVHFACSAQDARDIGFDDAAQYEELARPSEIERVQVVQRNREAGLAAFRAWTDRAVRHPY